MVEHAITTSHMYISGLIVQLAKEQLSAVWCTCAIAICEQLVTKSKNMCGHGFHICFLFPARLCFSLLPSLASVAPFFLS